MTMTNKRKRIRGRRDRDRSSRQKEDYGDSNSISLVSSLTSRRRRNSVVTIIVAATFGLPALFSPLLKYDTAGQANSSSLENNFDFRRFLFEDVDAVEEKTALPTADPNLQNSSTDVKITIPEKKEFKPQDDGSLPPYKIEDVFKAIEHYDHAFAVLVYKPDEDSFVGFYSQKHTWASSCVKLFNSLRSLTYMLRLTFPERFQKGVSPELVLAISGGDYPGVKITPCLKEHYDLSRDSEEFPCVEGLPPILHFGSVFRNGMFPSMIAMPMPDNHHLQCFQEWASSGTVCDELRPISEGGDLKFDDSREWDDLIPQVVWRGTDFNFLTPLTNQFTADFEHHVESNPNFNSNVRRNKAATRVLRSIYGGLTPRWKGVVHTAEAEHEAFQTKSDVPWANIKFSHHIENMKKVTSVGSQKFKKWEQIRFPAAGQPLNGTEFVKYRYHIDLGGGGGTTWTGTIDKLAMPGLLLHHVTPTKDYIHDRMTAWIHYVPVAPDLRDLKEKYDWAQNHPYLAKRIASQGTEFMRHLGTPEGFKEMFQENFVEPLRRVIDAYQPVPGGTSWRSVLKDTEGDTLLPVIKCSGFSGNSCEKMVGHKSFTSRHVSAGMRQFFKS